MNQLSEWLNDSLVTNNNAVTCRKKFTELIFNGEQIQIIYIT